MSLSKISTSNHWVQTYQALKEAILERKFGPNEKLSTPQLCEQLGVSPTPIRDALNRLESEGLVRTVSKVGTFVTPVDGNNVVDMTETRRMIEHWVIGEWHQYSAEQQQRAIERMQHSVDASRHLLNRGEKERYLQTGYDHDFHFSLVKLGGNVKNAEIYNSLMNYRFFKLGGPLVTLEKCLVSLQQHEAIVRAMRSGDVGRMKEAVSLHLNSSRDNLLEAIEQNGGVI